MFAATDSFPEPKEKVPHVKTRPPSRRSGVSRTLRSDFHLFTKLPRLAVDLDTVMQEFFIRTPIEDTVIRWAREIDGELVLVHGSLGRGSSFRL